MRGPSEPAVKDSPRRTPMRPHLGASGTVQCHSPLLLVLISLPGVAAGHRHQERAMSSSMRCTRPDEWGSRGACAAAPGSEFGLGPDAPPRASDPMPPAPLHSSRRGGMGTAGEGSPWAGTTTNGRRPAGMATLEDLDEPKYECPPNGFLLQEGQNHPPQADVHCWRGPLRDTRGGWGGRVAGQSRRNSSSGIGEEADLSHVPPGQSQRAPPQPAKRREHVFGARELWERL